MYVCICKAITQKQIEEKMLQHNGNINQTLKSLGVGTECGSCVEDAALEIQKKFNQLKNTSNHSHSLKSTL